MLLDTVAESLIKHPKGLELTIERLVAGSCATLEFSYIWRIMGARGTDGGLLSTVPPALWPNDLHSRKQQSKS